MNIAFKPPKRILMGPGPSDVPEDVLAAMAQTTIGHLDPVFVGMMDETKRLLQYAFKTENPMTMPISAPGSAGMESCFVNLVEPGDKVIVCRNGVFGERMRQNVERCGATAICVDDAWGSTVDMTKLDEAIASNPGVKAVAIVHAETSTGARSDVKAAAELAHKAGALIIVDAVTSLGGCELNVDEWQIDAIYSGSQKCLSCPPGLSPVSYSQAALDVLANRKSPVQSWFLDLSLLTGYWGTGKRAYHHTAPVNSLYGLHQALTRLHNEGLENAWSRHQAHHEALAAGLEAMGLTFVVDKEWRLPQLNSVTIPEGVDDLEVRMRLLKEFNLEIGAGLGDFAGKVWRIGLMGASCDRWHVDFCLESLGMILAEKNIIADARAGLDAAEQQYAS